MPYDVNRKHGIYCVYIYGTQYAACDADAGERFYGQPSRTWSVVMNALDMKTPCTIQTLTDNNINSLYHLSTFEVQHETRNEKSEWFLSRMNSLLSGL